MGTNTNYGNSYQPASNINILPISNQGPVQQPSQQPSQPTPEPSSAGQAPSSNPMRNPWGQSSPSRPSTPGPSSNAGQQSPSFGWPSGQNIRNMIFENSGAMTRQGNSQTGGRRSVSRKINYPIKFTYVNRISRWWPPEAILADIGVPGYAFNTLYDHFALAFWTSEGPVDMAKFWADPITYCTE